MSKRVISGLMLSLLSIAMLTLAFNVQLGEASVPPATEWNTDLYGAGSYDFGLVTSASLDVSIVSVTTDTTHQYPSRMVNIAVVVKNNGNVSATFYVTTYRNSTLIGNQTVTNLGAGASTTLTFNWSTAGLTPCKKWTIRAEALLVGDVNPGDNNVTDGSVKITMVGDVNADGAIDGQDFVLIIYALPSYGGHPWWNQYADLTGDGVVDGADLATALLNIPTCPLGI